MFINNFISPEAITLLILRYIDEFMRKNPSQMARELTDYERQYQEDLERAQALSLESLALEQFKNKRLQELNAVKNKNVSGEL